MRLVRWLRYQLCRKHTAKCQELGWVCVPIAAEDERLFSSLAYRLATDSSQPKSKIIADLYGCINLTHMRAIARAVVVRAFWPIGI